MLREYTILPVTAAAGLIAGAGTGTFLAAALSAAAAAWFAKRSRPADLCFVTSDPLKPDASIIPDAVRKALDRVQATGRTVRLRFAAFPPTASSSIQLSLTEQGDVELSGPRRTVALQRPRVWIPDHPLPLCLTQTRCLTLVFTPCGTDRIRVSHPSVSAWSNGRWLLLAFLAASACALNAGTLLAGSLAFAFQTYLLQEQNERAPDNANI